MMVRNIAGLLAVSFLFALPAFARAQRASTHDDDCSVRWTKPRALRVGDISAYMERPATLALRGRTLLLGPRVFATDRAGRPTHPLMMPGSRAIEAFDEFAMGLISTGDTTWDWVSEPPRVRSMPWQPEAVADSAGIAHVVWASNDSVSFDFPPTAPDIWYARFDGRHWTSPVRVATAHDLYWTTASVSPLVMARGELHLAIASRTEGIQYVHGWRDRWSLQRVGLPPTYFGYLGLAVMPNGRVVLIVQAPPPYLKNGTGGTVAATYSDDAGVTWAPPQLLSAAESDPAFDLALLVDGAGTLHALWYQQTDSSGSPAARPVLGNSPGRVQIAESRDGGVTWHRLQPTALLQNADGLRVLQLEDGSLLAAVVDRVSEHVLVARWRGRWQRFAVIPAAPDPLHLAIGWGAARGPVLTWGTRRPNRVVTTYYTVLALCR